MNAIFAVNAVDSFGTGEDMPWPRNKLDLQRFKALTVNNTVIMGRGTWDSDMPNPLPNRRNIVLSTRLVDHRCEVFRDASAVAGMAQDETVFVIGGAVTLWQLRPFINTVYLTRFNSSDQSLVVLDTKKYLENFELSSSETLDDHVFEIYKRM